MDVAVLRAEAPKGQLPKRVFLIPGARDASLAPNADFTASYLYIPKTESKPERLENEFYRSFAATLSEPLRDLLWSTPKNQELKPGVVVFESLNALQQGMILADIQYHLSMGKLATSPFAIVEAIKERTIQFLNSLGHQWQKRPLSLLGL